jgi:hypothetical protein
MNPRPSDITQPKERKATPLSRSKLSWSALAQLAIALACSLPIAGQTSRGGVTVGAYVAHAGSLTELHVTVQNDNDFMVKNVSYVIQWTCGDSSGTTAPGKNFDPVSLVAPNQTYDNSVNACTGTLVVQDVRLISFDKFQPNTQRTLQPAPVPAPPPTQASPTPSPKLTLDQTMKWIQVTLGAHGTVSFPLDYNPDCVSTYKVDSFSGCKVQIHVISTGCTSSERICTIDLSGLNPAVTWTVSGIFGEVILPVSDRTKQSCSLINGSDQIVVETDANVPSVQGLTNAFAYAIKLCGGAASPF